MDSDHESMCREVNFPGRDTQIRTSVRKQKGPKKKKINRYNRINLKEVHHCVLIGDSRMLQRVTCGEKNEKKIG